MPFVSHAIRATITLAALAAATRAADLTLGAATRLVRLDPATLAVAAGDVTLSAAQPDLGPVLKLTSTPTSATWTYSKTHVTTIVTLEDDTVTFRFSTDRPGTITFPSIPGSPAITTYLLPRGEGSRIPADDPDWIHHLASAAPLDTTADLSMTFLATQTRDRTVTYVLFNPFGNQLIFRDDAGRLAASLTHHFRDNWKVKEHTVRISLGPPQPLEPARRYRQHLVDTGQFVSLADKIARTPDAAKLLGAPHVYLWGGDRITPTDVKDFKAFAAALRESASPNAARLRSLLSPDVRQLLSHLATAPFVDQYTRAQITSDLSRILDRDDFPPPLLFDTFPTLLHPPETWGDGVSPKMIRQLKDAGLDRLRLLVSESADLRRNPATATAARDAGYLIGPYDSYHSIHPPNLTDTWPTAQFPDPALCDGGAILRPDGTPYKGFQQKGHLLSPLAARPFVEQRVNEWHAAFPAANCWFIDCDAFGQLYDDHSPHHPATQFDDMTARLSRLAWIRDAHNCVIGSEGGSSYAAGVLHFVEGIQTPVIGWGDPDLHKDKSSPHYLGAYWPPNAPTIFFKPVPLKPAYHKFHFDPRYRVPLYQAALHDSVITTHHWSFGSLKLSDLTQTRALSELLYAVPPLYHLNPAEFAKRKDAILAHYAAFSPLHRATATLPMTDFAYLSEDRLVQRTTFGRDNHVIANFSDHPFAHPAGPIPPRSALILSPGAAPKTYSPAP